MIDDNTMLRRFRSDETGVVLPLVAMSIVVLIGGAALAIDISRFYATQSSLQKAADAFALAGAAELDGSADSIDRAKLAVNGLMASQNTVDGVAVTPSAIRFYSSLPADDTDLDTSTALAETAQAQARFIEVRTQANLTTVFPLELVGLNGTAMGTGGVAVAGFGNVFCRVVPLFACDDGYTNGSVAVGKEVILKYPSGNTFNSGNFGFLDAVDTTDTSANGTKSVAKQIGGLNPNVCFSTRGVDLRTGNPSPVVAAVNFRFGVYNPPYASMNNNASYPPARVVRKGYTYTGGQACNANPAQDTVNATAAQQALAMGGDGTSGWDWLNYWKVGHGGAAPPSSYGWSTTTPPTRHDVYLKEKAEALAATDLRSPGDPLSSPKINGELARPECGNTSVNPDLYDDRRTIYMAIVTCPAGGLNGNQSNVPVVATAKFFITRPAASQGSDNTIYGEFQGLSTPSNTSNQIMKDIVVLYR
ncbi:pilus assembly protein TadG-related protein [Alsobacter sp. SYSU M60028]|uniref:Pilus assembly protein TadG-related protein n=1 Tax=Alsobacter ponti TaxID=2962936 RepID=A0ABT1LEB6_9HYPH|nr:pilus assembly protein TadG-related protein [Alsobacter ponti]MCP8939080.1 pilus assembly protein TadG-related protein [Alsobacter ponti]